MLINVTFRPEYLEIQLHNVFFVIDYPHTTLLLLFLLGGLGLSAWIIHRIARA